MRVKGFQKVNALGQRGALTHKTDLIAMLENHNDNVRYAAVKTLGQLDAAVLAQHAPAIVAKLEDSDSDVRLAAVDMLVKLKAAGKLDAAVFAQHVTGSRARYRERYRGGLDDIVAMLQSKDKVDYL